MEMLGMEFKSLLYLDVPTRWNSTYLMLEAVENFEKLFLRMDFENDGYSPYFRTKGDDGGMRSSCMNDFQNCRAFKKKKKWRESLLFIYLFFET